MFTKKCGMCGFVTMSQEPNCSQCHMPRGFKREPSPILTAIGNIPTWLIVTFVFISVVVGVLAVSLIRSALNSPTKHPVVAVAPTAPLPPGSRYHSSAKAKKAQFMADSVSPEICKGMDELTANQYFEADAADKQIIASCLVLRERAANPAAFEGALDLMDKEEARNR